MNPYVRSFFHRGMLFGGFGPLVLGIVYACIALGLPSLTLKASEVLVGILSTYLLAFVHAGASVFNQIEHWSAARSLFFHMGTLYLIYLLCYLINRWLPFSLLFVLIFTLVFIATYLLIFGIVLLSVHITKKRLNQKLDS